MMLLLTVLLALVQPLTALRLPTPTHPTSSASPIMQRRAAVAAGLALIPAAAMADSIEEIAARNAAAAEAARGEKKRCGYGALPQCDTEEEQDNGSALGLVGGVLVGSVALSVPFYWKNVARLATKITSGGKDDGYDSIK